MFAAVLLALLACLTAGLRAADKDDDKPSRLPGEAGSELVLYGKIRPGDGRMVWVRDGAGKHQAAKVYLEAGSTLVVLLPNGRLISRPARETQPCRLSYRGCGTKAIADELCQGEYADFKAKQSAHHVYIYNGSEEFTDMAAAILETMHAGVFDYFQTKGFDVNKPEAPLVVLIYKTEEQFREMSGAPESFMAFYSQTSNHIVLYETPKEGTPAINAAKQAVLETVAHEGVHQTLHNIGVQQRLARAPSFVTEGLAEYFAPTTRGASVTWAGVGQTNDFRWGQFMGFARSTGGGDSLVNTVVTAPRLDSDGYAVAWALVHYLAQKKPTAFAKYIQAVSARKPFGEHYGETPKGDLDEFREHFGDDLAGMQAAMVKHISGLTYRDPTRSDKHFIVAVEYANGRSLYRDARITLDQADLDKIRLKMAEEMA
ncbi:MAG TPA: DUF1570 domain-containing protein, partial [Pirellulales bacterium]